MKVKVVIACAGSKVGNGYWKTEDGKQVKFVARPDYVPAGNGCVYAQPDDTDAGSGKTWRELLLEYNSQWRAKKENPHCLLPAYRLYHNSIYRDLVERYDVENVFILSAGWGLIRADFLTPQYDITFSNTRKIPCYYRRKKSDEYNDCNEMPACADETIYLFSGKDYYGLFTRLIQGNAKCVVFYKSTKQTPFCGDCRMREYSTKKKTNWHYECVRAFMDGKIKC